MTAIGMKLSSVFEMLSGGMHRAHQLGMRLRFGSEGQPSLMHCITLTSPLFLPRHEPALPYGSRLASLWGGKTENFDLLEVLN
jgi:hypothetical protein